MGGNAGQHFERADRLGHIVGATSGIGSNNVFRLGQSGHENDRDVLRAVVGLEAARDFKAIHPRHQRIQQHDVRYALARTLQRRFTIGRDQHRVAGLFQCIVQQGQVFRHVIDDEDNVRGAAVNFAGRHEGLFADDR